MASPVELAALESPSFSDDIAQLARQLRRSTVALQGQRSAGSGIIWKSEGLIVTNAHVASRDNMGVTLDDGRRFSGEVVFRAGRRDLAVLRISATGLPAAPIGDSARLRAGELVFAVGHPHGLMGAVSSGIVHSVGGNADRQAWIEADIRLGPGSSGGPLANARGQVIGVNSMVADGLGLAIPSSAIERYMLPKSRRLGVKCAPVRLRQADPSSGGLLILDVAEGSPAESCGMLIGDVLRVLGGAALSDVGSLHDALARVANQQSMEVEILRGGKAVFMNINFSVAESDVATAA
ncbi:MAG: trypsin-like peptidase domain-containing protein [Candidatus Eremiobacteraeota bacterium]|nr:trypsin-like peptidase domain-containing protein [Candidatus Eremiobacteraeota bacterium]MBC5828160.1 trypsin-like peptidase domain-containing protein [Candidatus Eremiobacteraeota bacterium]